LTLYLDTSLLVAALTNEVESERIQDWLADQSAETLAISDWVITEFSAALSVKLRTGQIGPDHRARALALFTRMMADSFMVLPVSVPHFRTAARFADRYDFGLRAGDALHLALAAEYGATLCTLDPKLRFACGDFGVLGWLV